MNCAFQASVGRSRVLLRRARARAAGEAGQSLIEVVLATVIFAVVGSAMILLLLSALKTTNRSREKTLAQQAATTQIEQIRNLAYDDIGNVSGNPPGVIPLDETLSLNGLSADQTTKISYVNDPTPLSYQSYANYKKVSVTITRASDGHQLAQDVTYVAPPIRASQSQGQVVATVVDIGNNSVVPNYEVDIAGPNSFTGTDTTDTSGKVTFAALTPTNTGEYYDVTVPAASGYVPFKDTTPPATGVHFSLAPSQTQPVTVDVYKPATIYVQLKNSTGTTYAGAGTVQVTSSRGTQSFAYPGSQLAVTTLNGEPLVPGLNYTVAVSGGTFYSNSLAANVPSPPGYPTNLTSTFTFTNAQLATVTVTVQTAAAVKCNNAVVTVTGGPWSLGGATNPSLTATTNAAGLATFTSNVPFGNGYSITGKSVGNYSGTSTTTNINSTPKTANTITVTGC
jgi:type II secretory pathway pseudopilin PulG